MSQKSRTKEKYARDCLGVPGAHHGHSRAGGVRAQAQQQSVKEANAEAGFSY